MYTLRIYIYIKKINMLNVIYYKNAITQTVCFMHN